LAEAQLLGFFHSEKGFNLRELISNMGLTKNEWTEIQKKYELTYIKKEDKKEITEFLTSNK